jgi:hypothetical protein
MRNEPGTDDAAGPDRLRVLGAAARRRLAEAGPIARVALAAAAVGAVALGVLLARQPAPTAAAWLYDGHRFPPDDAARLVRTLAARGIPAQAVAGHVEVDPDRLGEALAALDKANLAPRSPEELLEPPPSSGFLPSAANESERRNRFREKYLEAEIEQIDDSLSATVQLFRTRKREALVPEEKVRMTVVLRVEGGRPVTPQVVERIRVKMLHLEPDLPDDALTVMDARGQMYLVAGSSAPAEQAYRRAREAELRGAILEQLDWIPDVRVGVKLDRAAEPASASASEPVAPAVAEIAASPALAFATPAAPAVAARATTATVAVNAPLDADEAGPPDAPPAGPSPDATASATATADPAPAAPASAPETAPAPANSRVSVVVRVPSDYYLRHYESVRGEESPSPGDLALFVTRTEESIRSAVALVVPREDLARLDVERIFVPGPARPALRAAPALRLPEAYRPAVAAAALGGASLLAIAAAGRVRASRRASRVAAEGASRSRRVRFDPGAPPAERVRDLVRRDPAAAAGVLQSWIGTGPGPGPGAGGSES